MEGNKERKDERDLKSGNRIHGKENVPIPENTRSNWNVMPVRGKVTDKCLWSACKAMTAGFLFIVVGAGMATLGFYSDHLSTVEETKGNTTIWVKNESKDTHLGSLTYLGPVVMGIGGFTIVAACVMTFEARDTAAKIVPIWFRRTRIHVVSGGSGSTPSGRSSKASWERFLSQTRTSEDADDSRTAVTQALVNFSKYLQNSVDANKISQHGNLPSNQKTPGIRKCPSEPNLGKLMRDANGNNLQEAMTLLEASTPQPSQRTTYGGGLKTMTRSSKPQLLSVAPDTYRQAVSMDCPRVSSMNESDKESPLADAETGCVLQTCERKGAPSLPFQTSCATSSSGSMSVDIYLPQGSVTLKVHDDMRDHKRFGLRPGDSDDSRGTKFSQHSDFQSFGDDDDFLVADIDDSVFLNPDAALSAPQIVLETLDSRDSDMFSKPESGDNHFHSESIEKTPVIEDWVSYPTAFISSGNNSESLEAYSPDDSLKSLSPTQFSVDNTDRDSPGVSITSVISNPISSRICDRHSLSQTDTSFFNVSSLGSMDSSQDINSPATFGPSSQFFLYNPESISEIKHSGTDEATTSSGLTHDNASRIQANVTGNQAIPESCRRHQSVTIDSDANESGSKISSRKHSSLESAEIFSSKSQPRSSNSPKRQQFSLESSDRGSHEVLPTMFSRYLSPSGLTSPTSPSATVLTFSPRKIRSESLPERRQAPSLKRFPLLRQVALDAFAEEGGSTHRLDRSQTQISSKDSYFKQV